MIHTHFEETITSGGGRSKGEWYFSYICYTLLFFKKKRYETDMAKHLFHLVGEYTSVLLFYLLFGFQILKK